MRFSDQTAFVTGAGSGIGRATAHRFAQEGATVVVADIDVDGGETTVSQIEDTGHTAHFCELDVRDEMAVTETIDRVAAEHGLDVLVNNAGVAHSPDPIEDVSTEMRDFVVETNALGAWNGCHAAIPHLKDRNSSAIVNVASVAGLRGLPSQAAYSLSKGAILNFTRAIAVELGPHGVRANAICPGLIETPLTSGRFDGDGEVGDQIPLGRAGQPADVADCIAFLASEDARYVSGHGFVVDGGLTAST